jgi:RNA polymerase sigma factor (sigma-70 family)
MRTDLDPQVSRDEQEPLREVSVGHTSAFRDFITKSEKLLFLIAVRITGDREAARDIVQDTFLGLLKSSEFSPERPEAVAYAATATRWRALGHASTVRRGNGLERGLGGMGSDKIIEWLLPRDEETPAVVLMEKDRQTDVGAALGELPEKLRAIVCELDIDGKDQLAVQKSWGLKPTQLHRLWFYAHQQLVVRLSGHEPGSSDAWSPEYREYYATIIRQPRALALVAEEQSPPVEAPAACQDDPKLTDRW